jgi:single-strand DNA-binding protein
MLLVGSKGEIERRRSNNTMQKVMLIGNLGRDPEVKYSQQGTAIAQFSVATTERWKDKGGELQEHTEWFAVKAFGRRAEVVGEHLHKGSRIYVEGRKRTEVLGRQANRCQTI